MRPTPLTSALTTPQLPKVGQRVYAELPGMHYSDAITICVFNKGWGFRALVLTDEGCVETIIGLRDGPGIGWHLGISPSRRWVQERRAR